MFQLSFYVQFNNLILSILRRIGMLPPPWFKKMSFSICIAHLQNGFEPETEENYLNFFRARRNLYVLKVIRLKCHVRKNILCNWKKKKTLYDLLTTLTQEYRSSTPRTILIIRFLWFSFDILFSRRLIVISSHTRFPTIFIYTVISNCKNPICLPYCCSTFSCSQTKRQLLL
jgi:hypothetical protein